jgi:hypothetical protein
MGSPPSVASRERSAAGERSGPLWRVAGFVVPSANASGVIFGAITMGALLAAESGRKETYELTLGSAVLVICVYWVAHAYATIVGRHLNSHRPLTPRALARGFIHDWALVRGAALPLVVILVAWATGATQRTAVDAAVYSVVACLICFELLQGLLSHARPAQLAYDVGVGALLGLGVLGLQSLFH